VMANGNEELDEGEPLFPRAAATGQAEASVGAFDEGEARVHSLGPSRCTGG